MCNAWITLSSRTTRRVPLFDVQGPGRMVHTSDTIVSMLISPLVDHLSVRKADEAEVEGQHPNAVPGSRHLCPFEVRRGQQVRHVCKATFAGLRLTGHFVIFQTIGEILYGTTDCQCGCISQMGCAMSAGDIPHEVRPGNQPHLRLRASTLLSTPVCSGPFRT